MVPVFPSTLITSWRRLFVFFFLGCMAMVGLFAPTWWSMVQTWWQSSTYFHCFAIIPLSGWLIWEERYRWLGLKPAPTKLPLLITLIAGVMWMFAGLAGILLLQQAAVLAMPSLLFWTLAGHRVAGILWFPLVFVIFALPFGEAMVPALQDVTAAISVWALQYSGIPVLLEGRLIQIPAGDFIVERTCSGIRYLIASLAVGSVFAYLFYKKWWKWAVFLSLSFIVPIIANGIRAYLVIMIAHWSDMRIGTGDDHVVYGWFFFVLVMAALMWAGFQFRDSGGGHVEDMEPTSTAVSKCQIGAPFAGYLFLVVGVFGIYYGVFNQRPGDDGYQLTLPRAASSWQGPLPWHGDGAPQWHHASQHRSGVYRQEEGSPVAMHIAYFSESQRQAELINSEHQWFTEPWQYLQRQTATVDLPRRAWSIHVYELQHRNEKRLLWHWYDVHGDKTASVVYGKWRQLLERLRQRRYGAASVVLTTDFDVDRGAAARRLKTFLTAMDERIDKVLWER